MIFLLSSNFDIESKEGQELIERIQNAYTSENKEEFLKVGEEIADLIVEKEIKTIKEQVGSKMVRSLPKEGENFIANMFKIVQKLTDMQAMAFIQSLVKIRRDSRGVMNDVLGSSDDIYHFLETISERVDKEQIEEGLKIKQGKAFYQVA